MHLRWCQISVINNKESPEVTEGLPPGGKFLSLDFLKEKHGSNLEPSKVDDWNAKHDPHLQ